ncbi:MAG: FliG C-terminal domain-containing protein [Paracoccaceae bacterium]|nr:FliG C-terminal domain-containing protein [Paracoccaceae bacterium]
MPNDLSLPSLADLPDLAPPSRGAPAAGPVQRLTKPQKAAVIVRFLLAEGVKVSLKRLPDEVQLALTQEMTGLRHINHATLEAVVEEFLGEIDAIGLQFPDGLEGALGIMGDSLTPTAAAKLRNQAGVDFDGDPWEVLQGVDEERLLPILERESVEVAAVILSKLKVSTAAALLGRLPGPLARRIAYSVSQIGAIAPPTVRRIGVSLADELDARPVQAFDDAPVARVGAILNYSTAGTRDDVLAGLEETDKAFAEEVKKAIFTFANIPGRVAARDIPRVLREVDQGVLVVAVAAAAGKDAAAAEFILANISQRMADNIKTEAAEKADVSAADGEAAMSAVVSVIRDLEAAGEIFLTVEDE